MKADDHYHPCGFLIWLALLLGTGLALVQPCAAVPFTFEQTGSLITGRNTHTATLLPDGKVLVAGGYNDNSGGMLASAEVYDPASGIWTFTNDSLANARYLHTATLLLDGTVLITGGNDKGPVGRTELGVRRSR